MKSYIPLERDEQRAVIDFCDLYKIKVVHIPNEGKRTVIGGKILQQQGLAKGFPDIFIPYARNGKHGLFIEMKRRKGSRVSDTQKEWIDFLNAQGYKAVIAYGAGEAIDQIQAYFKEGG